MHLNCTWRSQSTHTPILPTDIPTQKLSEILRSWTSIFFSSKGVWVTGSLHLKVYEESRRAKANRHTPALRHRRPHRRFVRNTAVPSASPSEPSVSDSHSSRRSPSPIVWFPNIFLRLDKLSIRQLFICRSTPIIICSSDRYGSTQYFSPVWIPHVRASFCKIALVLNNEPTVKSHECLLQIWAVIKDDNTHYRTTEKKLWAE